MTEERPARAPKPPESAQALAEAKRLYETTDLAVAAIARRVGLDRCLLRRRVISGAWLRPQETARREDLLRKVRAKLDAEVAAAERLFGPEVGLAGDDAAKAARTLTSMVRALRELARYDREQGRGAARDDADDACPDIDQFRRDLAERLKKLQSRDA